MNTSRQALRNAIVALSAYIVMSLILFGRPGLLEGKDAIGGGADLTIFMWALEWWPYALTHHLNPFITHLVWSPTGENLTWATSVPSLALLAWPITAVWGPIVAFNLVTLSAPVFAAFMAFVVCREVTGRFLPSLIGGWIFGFSSYEIGELLGHLHANFIACVPLITWLVIRRYKSRMSFPAFTVTTALALTLQLGISSEILATLSLCIVPTIVTAYALCKDERRRIFEIAKELIAAYLVFMILASPFVYFFLLGYHSAPPVLQPLNVYVADLLNYVVPTPLTAVGGVQAVSITKHFTGNYSEEGAYLGVFVLGMVGLSVHNLWGNCWTRVLFAMLVLLGVFSLGPWLHVMGHDVLPMPWLVLQKLPLLGSALPVRLTLYVSLVVALLVALWLASLEGKRVVLGYGISALSVISLLPNVTASPDPWFTPLPVPSFFERSAYLRQALQPSANVVVLPYGANGDSMLWQALSGMYFRMAGGYLQPFTPKRFTRWPAVDMLFSAPYRGYRRQIAAFCAATGVQAVIVAPQAAQVWRPALDRLGWRRELLGRVLVYHVPDRVFSEYKGISVESMRLMDIEERFSALRNAAECYLKKGGSLAMMTPVAAERLGCLDSAYGGFSVLAPNSNWTKDGGWLGKFSQGIGIGIVTNTGGAEAMIRRYGEAANAIYFPYPKRWQPGRTPSADRSGQLLLVFPKRD